MKSVKLLIRYTVFFQHNVKKIEAFLLLFAVISVAAFGQRPNVIVIYTDDQGTMDLGALGTEDLLTPNMDRIVRDGVLFRQFYASPICSPSRGSLLTGKVLQRIGLPGNAGSSKRSPGLPGNEYTMAEMFKSVGYATAHIGKWHVGYEPDMLPNAQGFDHSFGHLVGCIDNYSHFYFWNGPNRHDLYENGERVFRNGEFFPDLMVAEASRFIQKHRRDPFFIYLAFNMPHYPYQGDEQWLQYYDQRNVPYPRNLYNAFVSTLDERVGQVLGLLDSLDLYNNTIIVLQSDNGHSVEERAHYGGGYAGVYRGAKQCLFEGGIRVPAAISWPRTIPGGQQRNQLAANVDWMPTLAELCEIPLDTAKLDGKSLGDLLGDNHGKSPHATFCWQFKDMWAVRKGNWKLLGNPFD
ncbi:MAG: sulfatase-like hydrolase/transferase, partial [Bacteroidota bacterium]